MFIQLDSQVLYYEKEGEGSPVIMLHGNGEDHTIFDGLVPSLSREHTVYLLDSRGCGLSSPSEAYHYKDMAQDVVNLIRSTGIKRPSIFGFSDGGIIGLLIAAAFPDMLEKLIVCGANLSPKGLTFLSRRAIKAEYRKTKSAMVKMMLEEPNISEAMLQRIQVPTLVYAGEKDMIKLSETKRIADAVANSTLRIIPKADHMSYVVHSDLIADEVVEFLR